MAKRFYKIINKKTGMVLRSFGWDIGKREYCPVYIHDDDQFYGNEIAYTNYMIKELLRNGHSEELKECELLTIEVIHKRINGNVKLNNIIDRKSQEIIIEKLSRK